MSLYYFLLFPLITALLSCCVFGISAWFFLCTRKFWIHSTSKDGVILEAGKELINSRLEDLVKVFKKQIPMVGMFLSGSKEESLKESARQELFKLIPEFQHHLAPILIKSLWTKWKRPLFGIIFLLGLLVGILQMCLFLLFW